jgi:hypothetical protein
MMSQTPKISDISEINRTPLVVHLFEEITHLKEEIQSLKDEIARLKGQKPRPEIPPSQLENKKPEDKPSDTKRPGSEKRKKSAFLTITETKKISPENVPDGSWLNGCETYVVQDIRLEIKNTMYLLERWQTPDGKTIMGKLPPDVAGSHFGSTLQAFILCQYYHAHVTQPLLLEMLHEMGIDISSGQLSRIITEGKERYHLEKDAILAAGLEVSRYIQTDDTGARHNGKNGVCTFIGNDMFSWFKSTESKSRINFLELLRTGYCDYVISLDALSYMSSQDLPKEQLRQLVSLMPCTFMDQHQWLAKLKELEITNARHIRIATEGALIGSILEHGFNPDMVIISDDAGQFNILKHALCWIHAERTIHKLIGYNDANIKAIDDARTKIWNFYAQLKAYKESPVGVQKAAIEHAFDEIFTQKTCFESLNQALKRIHRNKKELLIVLDRPDIPLHNNLSENDIREYVKKRKISGSTRSDTGRKCRDTFTSLKKTCRKLGISFWNYLKDRTANINAIPPLPDLIRENAST